MVLFDMGGVLVELAPLESVFGLDGAAAEEFWPRWLSSDAVRRFESGKGDIERFGRELVADLDLALTPEETIERFRRFPQGLFPGAVDLVASVADDIETGVLSNTNELHWQHQIDAPTVQGLCDRAFLSYQLGLVKPDAAIFEAVVDQLGCAAQSILFVDDNQINVDGARSAGLMAELAKGPSEAAEVLVRYGATR